MARRLKKRLIIIHPYTFFDPGRFLEDALRKIGFEIALYDKTIDFGVINQGLFDAVLYIESPYRPQVQVSNPQKIRLPRFFWILHGESRLELNIRFIKEHRIDCVLLATSAHLAKSYQAPFQLLPMAVEPALFPNRLPLSGRFFDISFVGASNHLYRERDRLLELIKKTYPNLRLNFTSGVYLREMGEIYANSKIVFNWNYGNVLTMRLFEGMAAGAVMLTNQAHGIEMLGTNRRHYVIYRNPPDLIHKIDFYLANLSLSQLVASRGYQKVLGEHTYLHRARQLEGILQRYPSIN